MKTLLAMAIASVPDKRTIPIALSTNGVYIFLLLSYYLVIYLFYHFIISLFVLKRIYFIVTQISSSRKNWRRQRQEKRA